MDLNFLLLDRFLKFLKIRYADFVLQRFTGILNVFFVTGSLIDVIVQFLEQLDLFMIVACRSMTPLKRW